MFRLSLMLSLLSLVLIGVSSQVITPEPEAAGAALVIWLPEKVAPADDEAAWGLFNEQIETFVASEQGVAVEVRRKHPDGVGGILETLRTASTVAPDALPDLTLMRYDDLQVAVDSGLIQPLTLSDFSLYEASQSLGSRDDQVYGIPYLLDPLLVAYTPPGNRPLTEWSLDEVLRRQLSFAAPLGTSNVFLVQYLAAGGTPPVTDVMILDEDALLTTLLFYEQARESGLVDETLLQYTTPGDYETQLADGTLDAGIVELSSFQRLQQANPPLRVGYIPTATGERMTVLDGWMWVMVTRDVDEQVVSERLIQWIMNPDRQGEYAQTLGMLSSQPDALRLHPLDVLESDSVGELLSNAILPLSDESSGSAIRLMQAAAVAVLSGERTAEQATSDAISQLSG